MRALSSQTGLTRIYSVYIIQTKLFQFLYLLQSFNFMYFKYQIIFLLLGIPQFIGTQFVQGIKETQAGANEPM